MAHHRSRHTSRIRRSPKEWAGRIALASGLAVLAYQSAAFSAAQVVVKTRPEAAATIAPYDGRLTAAYAATLLASDDTAETRDKAARLSRMALHRDPTAVAAVATLGLVTLGRNDTSEAHRLLAYGQMLSRRNVQIQLWSIEDAVTRGDVPAALHWYDITLRTDLKMSDILYPVLTKASQDPEIRSALVRTLAAKPSWANNYVSYVSAQTDNPQNTATLLGALRVGGVAIPAASQAAVVGTLLNAGDVDRAWRYYTAIRPGADRARSRDPRFAALIDTPSAFDWTPLSDSGIAASIQRTGDGGAFEFSAPASIGGPVLQQVQLLPAGDYRLVGQSENIAQDTHALPYWMLTCHSDNRELGRVVVPNSAQAGGRFEGVLTVPANCTVQTLTLYAQPSDAIGGTSGRIDRIALEPLGKQSN
jgi:hypothetical protein